MGQFVIAAYKPKPGKEALLLEVVREHVPILRKEGLVTLRPAHAMKCADGTIVEVFEWESAEAIAAAHTNPAVIAMWKRFDGVCEIAKLVDLEESKHMFAGFTPLEL
ncbi:MAG: antibiotic biosynthesis monooxygenase [Candidatus Eisenbacteria bacterium]